MQKGKLLALVMALVLMLAVAMSASAVMDYEVIKPANYSKNLKYPVVYVMPRNGTGSDDSAITSNLKEAANSGLGIQMLIVKPRIKDGMDIQAELSALVTEIDSKYSTIADPQYRAVVGTGVGGYLAYAATLLNSDATLVDSPHLFGIVGSINGNFANNNWVSKYGNLITTIDTTIVDSPADTEEPLYGFIPVPENNNAEVAAYLGQFYTYMDTPVDGTWANDEGSTNAFGAFCIDKGISDKYHEYTARPGVMTADFMTESVNRISDRFSQYMLRGVASGSVELTNASLSADAASATANYSVTIDSKIATFNPDVQTKMAVTVKLVDPSTGNTLDSASKTHIVKDPGTFTGSFSLDNTVNDVYSDVQLSVKLLNETISIDNAYLIRTSDPVIDGDKHSIDLMGDWRFNYVGNDASNPMTGSELMAADYKNWSIAQPGFNNWTRGYGNINNDTVQYGAYMSDEIFNLMILGSGYYAKTFEVPADFTKDEIILSIGKIDDRCEVYVNGHFVGATGMENHVTTDETTWAVYSYFTVDPSYLNYGEENVVFVRAFNDLSGGAGGWYQGPIGLYSAAAFEEISPLSDSPRFYEETYYSESVGAEKEYLIYLPEGYEDSDRFYPTVYLLHQFNSDHTSYRTDAVNELFDEAISEGLFDEMIVVIPNSNEMGFWMGQWSDMVTKDLIPHIEANYRCIPDPRYRLTAGCSMGGQGAMGVALTNPNLFSGAVSFFGAFTYGDSVSPNSIAPNVSDEYLDYFTLYFNCGNQDYYGFGTPAIDLNKQLQERGIDHYFFIENGGHDSAFYVPYFKSAFQYTRNNMYQMPEANIKELLEANYGISRKDNALIVSLEATEGIREYYLDIPESEYTVNTRPGVTLPVIVTLKLKGGEEVTVQFNATFNRSSLRVVKSFDLDEILPENAKIVDVKVHTQLLGGNYTKNDGIEEVPVVENPDLPETGDSSNLMLLCAMLFASVAGIVVISRKKAAC